MVDLGRLRLGVWIVVGIAHIVAILVAVLALSVFLTPADQIARVPSQPIRYALYATAIFALACAAGTVVAYFVAHGSWLPVIYLWSVPFGIVLYPAIDPGAANFVYVGITSHIAGPLAILASVIWVIGIGLGVAVLLRATTGRPE